MNNKEFTDNIKQVVSLIPEGQVATYGQVARLAGFPAYARQVGMALANLPNESLFYPLFQPSKFKI